MYQKIRAIHLCTGLFCFAFLAMYGASAVQMAHRHWFHLGQQVAGSTVQLEPALNDSRVAARGIPCRGELTAARATPGGLQFRIVRPGTVCEVEYMARTGEAKVKETRSGVLGMLNRLHHVHGMWHAFPLLNLWSAVLGLASAGLVALGLSGIYLWFRNRQERMLGTVLLSLGCGLTVLLIIAMRNG